MARKTDKAFEQFGVASSMAGNAKGPVFLTAQEVSVDQVDVRLISIAFSLEAMGDGLQELAAAIKDVYDKLGIIDRKLRK